MDKLYDVIVIGGGPAGCTAAMYAARSGLSTLLLEKMSAGGQMNQTTQIDNYPGFDDGIDGFELGRKMHAGVQRADAQTQYAEVLSVDLTGKVKTIRTKNGELHSRTVIIATGADHKHLGLAEEENLIGRGVAYCATCDGMFFRGKTVAVVGGGNSAAADALYLSRIAKKVILIHRRDTLRAAKIYHQQLQQMENVEILWNQTVKQLLAEMKLTGVKLENTVTGEECELSVDGLFISVGRDPQTALFADELVLDEAGYILADETTQTSIKGVFAVGDVRTKAVRQIVTAASDGCVAAYYAEKYLLEEE